MSNRAIALAVTGASGAPYGLRLLELLLRAEESVYLMLSAPGRLVVEMETGLKLPESADKAQSLLNEKYGAQPGRLRLFGETEWAAPVASGTNAPKALVVCPCTAGTLAAMATGQSRNLIERAADVAIKEHRKLIVVPREMPLSAIHLENMLALTRLGVVVMPASPGFYHRPESVSEMVDFVVARVLDHLRIEHDLMPRWGA